MTKLKEEQKQVLEELEEHISSLLTSKQNMEERFVIMLLVAAVIRPVVIPFTDQIFVTSKPCEARHNNNNNNNNNEYRGCMEQRPQGARKQIL